MEQKSSGSDDIKVQAKSVFDKLMGLATSKYRINFEVYGWIIGLVVLVLLILLAY